MTRTRLSSPALLCFLLCLVSGSTLAQYNKLRIPDTLSGTSFDLSIRDTFLQLIDQGNQTITGGINGPIWGPTLIMNQGDIVQMKVHNYLNDSTTLHWHGMHLPAVMDGGPHQVIPPGTTWEPYWKVTNNAATYWYHPHLHEMTMEQVTKGIGGLIIVRDSLEAALHLPRTYGVDDIPLAITDRRFNKQNQFVTVPYGDSVLVNGTLRPEHTVPSQVVRLRILNGAIERSYNLGFSDNRTFYVIATDGGLLKEPVPMTRLLLSAGERVELLVNCTGQEGTTVDLMAYNSTLTQFMPGGEDFPMGPFANALGRKDFRILHLRIGEPTDLSLTTIPASLVAPMLPLESEATFTRNMNLSDSMGVPGLFGPVRFLLDHKLFDIKHINFEIPLGRTEIWEIQSESNFGHPFHIHDVQFSILTRNGIPPPPHEQGWKDVVFINWAEQVRLIARFADYADKEHPFMYHCHILLHEDEGMMGQFIVKDDATSVTEPSRQGPDFSIYPNPASRQIRLNFNDQDPEVYYLRIFNSLGKTVLMLPRAQWQKGIDISGLPPGVYHVQVTEEKTFRVRTQSFVKPD